MVEKGNEVEEPIGEAEELPEELEEALPELGEEAGKLPEGLKGLPGLPAFMGTEEPTGEENRAKYWILHEPTWTDEEIAERKNLNPGTVRIARSHLARDGFIKKGRKPPGEKQKALPAGAALAPRVQEKGIQVFAKGSPPEAIIEGIKLPLVDGQAEGFEKGMKFGMSVLTMAVRIMQELSAVSLQQVQPLIALTRTVREGEQAAFKGGADEGALKAARAMGETVLPALSEMQASIATAIKGSEPDPFKGMMARTMEPLLKNMVAKMFPGMQTQGGPPAGFTEETR